MSNDYYTIMADFQFNFGISQEEIEAYNKRVERDALRHLNKKKQTVIPVKIIDESHFLVYNNACEIRDGYIYYSIAGDQFRSCPNFFPKKLSTHFIRNWWRYYR